MTEGLLLPLTKSLMACSRAAVVPVSSSFSSAPMDVVKSLHAPDLHRLPFIIIAPIMAARSCTFLFFEHKSGTVGINIKEAFAHLALADSTIRGADLFWGKDLHSHIIIILS